MIDQLNHVQEAIEPIQSSRELSIDVLSRSVDRLTSLQFLPKIRAAPNSDQEKENLEAEAERFLEFSDSLKEVALDCVMAISKISLHLQDNLFGND